MAEQMKKEDFVGKERFTFDDFAELVDILRAPDGCPWDRAQTHTSIRNNFIEEVYEAVEGIDKNDSAILREELGDVLLQILLHTSIAQAEGEFTLEDVISDICKKLVFRHPHVFGEMPADSPDAALQNWDELKKREKGQKTPAEAVVSVTSALPALMRAQKLQSKAVKNGFTLPEPAPIETPEPNARAVGKLLFSICAFCARNGIDAEQALYEENRRFCAQIARQNI